MKRNAKDEEIVPYVQRNGLIMSKAEAERYDLLSKMRKAVRNAQAFGGPLPDPELEQAQRTLAEIVPPIVITEILRSTDEMLKTMDYVG